MQDAADDAAVIDSFLAPHVCRKQRRDPPPLIIAQPKQITPHIFRSPRRQRIDKSLPIQQLYWVLTLV
jgi:hypothetical protein